jgi:hypothetical protein
MTGRTASEPVPILLVEDDPGDAALTGEAFAQSPVPAELHLAANAELAMRFCTRPASSPPRPGPP